MNSLCCLLVTLSLQSTPSASWRDAYLDVPLDQTLAERVPRLTVVNHPVETPMRDQSVVGTPLRIGDRGFTHGLGVHAPCQLRVTAPVPISAFRAWVGVDENPRSTGGASSITFAVNADGRSVYASPVMTHDSGAARVDVTFAGARMLELSVGDGGDGYGWDHADWAEAELVFEGGETMRLSDVRSGAGVLDVKPFPFSMTYGGRDLAEVLGGWREEPVAGTSRAWTDPESGLRVSWEVTAHDDFPAVAWMLRLENTGDRDTPIIENVQVVDLTLVTPLTDAGQYRLHSIRGGVPNPTMFMPQTQVLSQGDSATLCAGNGRSSTANTPFFKIDTGEGALVAGIEWSGDWTASCEAMDGALRLRAGMTTTHFRLRPGEQVRMPRVLMLFWEGDSDEANAQFRQLLHKHYAARRAGHPLLPVPFCNTCFTRGGGWLNETTAENQISLIRAYAKIGLEALITDAGWFEGGWPDGAGNWTPRRDSYPGGMAPVAAAARGEGMVYGLWFEPERVIHGTQIHREHPEWCLDAGNPDNHTLLLNFGLPEVQDYFFGIVKGFMDLPGFDFYRQDFNMDPLPYWKANDAEDRQGITEIRYIEGLYAYWDRIRAAWPGCLMEECASGGHRIDLGTVIRMHLHQKSDYWFDDEADLLSLWSISQYLPNNTIVAHLRELDDYAFHANLASSVCLGWIADAEDFDAARGKELLDRYHAVKHLLVGAWYPLLPWPGDPMASGEDLRYGLWHADQRGERVMMSQAWVASQYHRPDLDEGMLLLFRRPGSPYATAQVRLRGLNPEGRYEMRDEVSGALETATGAELMETYAVEIAPEHASRLILYRRSP